MPAAHGGGAPGGCTRGARLIIALEVPPRIPPQNVDAERAVLGAVLLEGREALPRVVEILRATDFATEAHRAVYRAVLALHEREEAVDHVTVQAELWRVGDFELAGGAALIAQLMEEASIAAHLHAYVAIVRDLAVLRELIQAAATTVGESYDARQEPHAIAAALRQRLDELAERADPDRAQANPERTPPLVPLHQVLEATALTLRFDLPDLVPSPVAALNERFGGGFKRGELILLGGGPGAAKSALMGWWARYAAQPEHGGHLTAIASLEMGQDDIGQRILADAAQVSATALRRQDLQLDEWERIDRIIPTFEGLPVLLTDQVVHVKQLGRMLRRRRERRERPIRLLIVDYLQLLEGPPAAARYQEVGLVGKLLKRLAKKYDCTVLALSSITPDPPQKGRKGKRQAPTMRNLRESRDLDHAADVILMLWQPDPTDAARELIIDKGRHGAADGFRIRLQFTPMYQRFMEL